MSCTVNLQRWMTKDVEVGEVDHYFSTFTMKVIFTESILRVKPRVVGGCDLSFHVYAAAEIVDTGYKKYNIHQNK